MLLNAETTHGIFSTISSWVKSTVNTIANAISSSPFDQPLSDDPKIGIAQLRERLQKVGLHELQIDLEKLLNLGPHDVYEKVRNEMKSRLPRRSVEIVGV